MKNREKYAEEILDIACSGKNFAIDERIMQIRPCEGFYCEYCLFGGTGTDCEAKIEKWAESEYIEPVKISKKDRAFLDYIEKSLQYIARDTNGKLYLYKYKPYKAIDCWDSDDLNELNSLMMFCIDFPMIKWSDAEPWKIEDLKKLEVCEKYGEDI